MLSGSAPMQPVTITLPFCGQGLADGGKRLLLGAVEEAAGVDDHEVGALMLAGELIALRAQARDDALAIDQRLGAAEGDEAHLGSADSFISGFGLVDRQELVAIGGQIKALCLAWAG